MNLAGKLTELREGSAKKFPSEVIETMGRATAELRESGIMESALSVGAEAPAFSLENTAGETINSKDLIVNGPLVVTFYRGVW